ncbi:MAG: double-strand break repair protein AddB [Alphaproteobacteria bacterium]|nr:double-strand break repair protein AddB [Alphaproteobacteria bacterium]
MPPARRADPGPSEAAAPGGVVPRVYTIAPEVPFLDALAAGVLALHGEAPEALSRVEILLPTRRAARALAEAFLRATGGKALLLPRIAPLGDIDEDGPAAAAAADLALPPAMPPLRLQALLARLVLGMGGANGAPTAADQAFRLAGELALLLDEAASEGVDLARRLPRLVPDEYAYHWQETLRFLALVTEHAPRLLAEAGMIGAAARRDALLRARAAAWEAAPPAHAVIAAGSTGTVPATAELLRVIARLPRGAVILPGLDRAMPEPIWAAMDDAHPQAALRRLLARLGIARAAVADWPHASRPARPAAALRTRLIALALRPAGANREADPGADPGAEPGAEPGGAANGLAEWLEPHTAVAADAGGCRGLWRLDAATQQEEAGAIALLLREALEEKGRTAALVTPDRALARRVVAELSRFGLAVDDSGGEPLADTPPATFLRLAGAMLAEDFAPVPLLAALKHPLASGGDAPARFRAGVRALERAVLRGARPPPGLGALRTALAARTGLPETERKPAADMLARLDAALRPAAPLRAATPVLPTVLLAAHLACAEALAATDAAPGAARLWAGEAGEALAARLNEAAEALAALGPVAPRDWPALFAALLEGAVLRRRASARERSGHPRLAILGTLEARLLAADTILLAGLNETVWPPATDPGPWLSRPMRLALGLPAPERRIGQAAHDFAQMAAVGETVVLTRSAYRDGAPAVPSRWLVRLDAFLKGQGRADGLPRPLAPLAWTRGLNSAARYRPEPPPAPAPAPGLRPRSLSVTQIETWRRDPYAVYARHILRLKALDPLDAEAGPAEFGMMVHEAMAGYLAEVAEKGAPADPLPVLLRHGESALAAVPALGALAAFWWPRFAVLAAWMAEQERARRPGLRASVAEVEGAMTLSGLPGGPFCITARADRIDTLADGTIAIIDYKTGAPPRKDEIERGFAPQLTLEALIAAQGGFAPKVAAGRVVDLAYWQMSGGGETPARIVQPFKTPEALAAVAGEALAGMRAWIAAFDDPAAPYRPRPYPDMAPRYSDYAHLARVAEWSAGGAGEEDGGEGGGDAGGGADGGGGA